MNITDVYDWEVKDGKAKAFNHYPEMRNELRTNGMEGPKYKWCKNIWHKEFERWAKKNIFDTDAPNGKWGKARFEEQWQAFINEPGKEKQWMAADRRIWHQFIDLKGYWGKRAQTRIFLKFIDESTL